jgi:hypothetical protein
MSPPRLTRRGRALASAALGIAAVTGFWAVAWLCAWLPAHHPALVPLAYLTLTAAGVALIAGNEITSRHR